MSSSKLDHLQPITDYILDQKEELVHQLPSHKEEGERIINDLMPWRYRLIEVYANSILLGPDASSEELEKWGRNVSGKLVELGLPLDIALQEISHYRNLIGDIIKEEAKVQGLLLDDFYYLFSKFNQVVDRAVHLVSQSYMEEYQDNIKKAQYSINELSVPLVKITNDLGVIPLIGEIDTKRAQTLLNNALEQGDKQNLETIVIDLSGVHVIDTMVAHQIFKVIDALKVIGIRAVISGIRPDISQTMTNLGISMKHVDTFSSLHIALERVARFKNNN
ncbi:STAS domain-containing protein [Pontibacillus sp. HMF3514]|uniref:STAS domain-containing protein n=1 Tax=Pontibacillus sp. HMF3514 TaxID=2692425 RepID=UPI0013203EA3|nr:STAS domain-containing protein [Pontibacillus sp. HMF3514]QHE51533.1 STAS domain-containing protein [Pontibacillus sp. HMF3514]